MSVSNGDVLRIAVKQMCSHFENIRGKDKQTLGDLFWDLVVVTASDEEQKKAFDIQIQNKLDRKEIPTGLPYLVFADTPGPKMGCGGSTMLVLSHLYKKYSTDLYAMRVLLVHAGGQSQRLPSASVLGKLFSPLPMGKPIWQLFDVKLASYLPLLSHLKPGIFHAAADTIEIFALDGSAAPWSVSEQGLTALAHPSSLEVGQGHGVFVLDTDHITTKSSDVSYICSCKEVLQKPSTERMTEKGAIVHNVHNGDTESYVYTDSCFYFSHGIAEKLHTFYKKEAPLNCEICSYGDFMQCLGSDADIGYTNDTKNVRNVEENLVNMRKKVFHLLHDSPFCTLVLKESKFFHFGTMREYIYHLCEAPYIADVLSFNRFAFSVTSSNDEPVAKKSKDEASKLQGCVMHSKLSPGSLSDPMSVIEYCNFSVPITVKSNCILSNCTYTDDKLASIYIPEGTFLHTAPVTVGNKNKYATAFFSVDDNLKKGSSVDKAGDLKFLGATLNQVSGIIAIPLSAAMFSCPESPCTLWTWKFFAVADSASESFEHALEMLLFLKGFERAQPRLVQSTCLSMHDIVQYKSVETMVADRNSLYKDIQLSL